MNRTFSLRRLLIKPMMAVFNRGGHILRQTVTNNEFMSSVPMRCMSSWKLFVGGLGPDVNSRILWEAFSVNDERVVIGAKPVVDRKSGRCRGYGFVEFVNCDAASSSIEEMDQWVVHGRTVTVRWAKDTRVTYTWEDSTIDDIYAIDGESGFLVSAGVEQLVKGSKFEHKPGVTPPPGSQPTIYNKGWCAGFDPFTHLGRKY